MTPLIEFRGISRHYGRGDTLVKALDAVDLTIEEGEFVAVMGPSGSGKSTCMNVIGSLDTPTAGQYFFRGTELTGLTRHQRALYRRNYIGFVFQGYNLLKRTSALENTELPLIYRRMAAAERHRRAREALGAVGLADRADHTSSELSGGQQQRVAIARALVSEPALLLADEPTGNLDSVKSREILELLTRLNRERGITILMVTHDADLSAFASRTIRFRDGKIAGEERRGG
ncbi:MAG: ABC transporter ATP-binding protein [Alphaproteobacteria bacterium]